MAQTLTNQEIESIQTEAKKIEEDKIMSQSDMNKVFVNNGQGVMPETVWENPVGKNIDPNEVA